VKKTVVAVLIILALVVIVSPGILGRLAEKSVDENLNWAASEQGDVVVNSDKFDRGWFSSEGQHRVEVKGGQLRTMLAELNEDGTPPVLIINTHLDHGLIPFSSLSRENGSLAPGLGSAVSTLSLELGDGSTIEIPGKIYSKVGLGGEVASSYQVQAGSRSDGQKKAAWGTSRIDVTTNPVSGDVSFAGDIRGIQFSDRSESIGIDGLTFSGNQSPTKYGFSIGDMKMELDGMSVSNNGIQAGGIKAMSVDGQTAIDGDRVGGRTTFKMQSQTLPQFGEVTLAGDVSLEGADAEALGKLTKTMNALGPAANQNQAFAAMEGDLKRLLAAGLELRFDQLDVLLPMGTVEMQMNLNVAKEDADTFEWTSLLLGTQGSAQLSVPEALVDMALAMNPQAGAIVGMGFLAKSGDAYKMDARLEKGLLTINGAPIPIPLGGL
jgi:uncharacterized protein YdgA (DUF945 family)